MRFKRFVPLLIVVIVVSLFVLLLWPDFQLIDGTASRYWQYQLLCQTQLDEHGEMTEYYEVQPLIVSVIEDKFNLRNFPFKYFGGYITYKSETREVQMRNVFCNLN